MEAVDAAAGVEGRALRETVDDVRASQPRVDGLRLEREDGEDGFVDAPQRLARTEPRERLQAERDRASIEDAA